MTLKDQHIYFLKEEFFDKYKDYNLNFKQTRPYIHLFNESNGISWVAPLSSQTDKYQRVIDKKEKEGKRSDILHVCKIGDRKQAILIQDMIPVRGKDIKSEYKRNNEPYKLKSNKDKKTIQVKANRVKGLIEHEVSFMRDPVRAKDLKEAMIREAKNQELKRKKALQNRKNRER